MNIYEKDDCFFAAANTADGFKSYFDEIFGRDEIDRLYILKGGPGVGKSTFMKRLGELYENTGGECEYFFCSSDPDSLDGIIIKGKRAAVIDGTMPHAVEPSLAGVREIIIDLGRAWDTDSLYQSREVLIELSDKKSLCYKDCYRLLSCKKTIDSLIKNLVLPYINTGKLEKSANKISKAIFGGENEGYSEKVRITKAISTKGRVRLSTFENMAARTVFIKEPFEASGLADMILKAVYDNAKSLGKHFSVSFSTEENGKIDALYFPDSRICVTKYDEQALLMCDKALKKSKVVNCTRFLDSKGFHHLSSLRKFYSKLSEKLENQAIDKLKEAGEIHAEMEKIYGKYTDYAKVEEISREYFSKILA